MSDAHLLQSATETRFWTRYKLSARARHRIGGVAGTGQHAAFFAPRLAPRYRLPTDVDEISLSSIEAWRETSQAPNLLAPQRLDVLDTRWLAEDIELPEPSVRW